MTQHKIFILLAVCIAGVPVGCGKKKPSDQSGEKIGFYCIETKEEYHLSPEEVLKCKSSDGTYNFSKLPKLRNRKWVMMTYCPNCSRFFLPEHLRSAFDVEAMTSAETNGELICPYCATDVVKWHREHRKAAMQPSKSPS